MALVKGCLVFLQVAAANPVAVTAMTKMMIWIWYELYFVTHAHVLWCMIRTSAEASD